MAVSTELLKIFGSNMVQSKDFIAPVICSSHIACYFFDNFSQENKLGTIIQTASIIELNFSTANLKIRKKKTIYIFTDFINKRLTVNLEAKYKFK